MHWLARPLDQLGRRLRGEQRGLSLGPPASRLARSLGSIVQLCLLGSSCKTICGFAASKRARSSLVWLSHDSCSLPSPRSRTKRSRCKFASCSQASRGPNFAAGIGKRKCPAGRPINYRAPTLWAPLCAPAGRPADHETGATNEQRGSGEAAAAGGRRASGGAPSHRKW